MGALVKKYAVVTTALLLLTGCALFLSTKRYVVPIEDSPQLGPENAPVTIVEFLGFQ